MPRIPCGGGRLPISLVEDVHPSTLSSPAHRKQPARPPTWGIDDGVMVLLSEELLGGAGNGHTTGALLLLGVHVEGEGEGGLAQAGGLLLQLLQLTLGDAAQLEDEAAGCRRGGVGEMGWVSAK